MADKIKHLVSKKKRRFIEDGFDLDLAYIKPNIIAMGFPSENLEGVYRNHLDDVHRFLELKHRDKYKVYNLCSEKNYDPVKFGNRVSQYGFDDHNAPPFELIRPCCADMAKWLDAHEDNVAIVHCKAGKGRTGVMICAYLLYKHYFKSAIEAMDYYAEARTQNKKGVTIPSQRRYITYFSYYVRNNYDYVPKTILLNSVTFIGVPTFNSGTCCPSLIIFQTKVMLYKSKSMEVQKNQSEIPMDIGHNSIPICGDIRIDVFHKDFLKKERMLVFWFNTYFLERGVSFTQPDGGGVKEMPQQENGDRVIEYTINKLYLDKANKDKKDKLFPENFAVRLNITIPQSTTDNGSVVDGQQQQQQQQQQKNTTTSNSKPSSPSSTTSLERAEGEVISSASSHKDNNKCSRSTKPNKILNNRNENSTFYIGDNERSQVITASSSSNNKKSPATSTAPTARLDCSDLKNDFTRLCVNPDTAGHRLSRSIEDLARFDGRDHCSDDSDDDDDEMTI